MCIYKSFYRRGERPISVAVHIAPPHAPQTFCPLPLPPAPPAPPPPHRSPARSPAHHHQCAVLSPASGRPAPARSSTAPSPSPLPHTPTGATVSTKSSGAKTPKPLQRPPRPPPHPQPPSSRPRQYSIPQTTWKRSMRAVCQSPDSPRPLASGTFLRASLLPTPARYNPH